MAVKAVLAARGRREVFAQVRDEVARQLAELRPDLAPSQVMRSAEILAALAVHETGGGVTIAWREGFNFGNVTAGSKWAGEVIAGPDTEPNAAGEYVRITQAFRKYATLGAAVSDWLLGVLNWRREREEKVASYLYAGDADGFARALSRAGYYTAPVESYARAVSTLSAQYGSAA